MTTQQQESQLDGSERPRHRIRHIPWVRLVIAFFVLVLIVVVGLLNFQASVILAFVGVIIGLFQWLFPMTAAKHEQSSAHTHPSPTLQNTTATPAVQPIIVHVPVTQPLPAQLSSLEKVSHRGITGIPPPTDSRTIQQREQVVKDAYTQLTRPGVTAIALTGIGGIGKSTLAALIYRYAEEQHLAQNGPFQAETLWYTIDPAVTFADLAGNLFEALGKPLPDLSNLGPQNQAVALFNALHTTDAPRLVILDQFENLLDWDTGHALADRPGVGEWLDMLNSQQCNCRILLTSRPRPVGTREFPPTYLQEYPVEGLEANEGIALLRNQGVQGTDEELRTAVLHCAGHALSLTLLASLLRDHHLNLVALFKHESLWTGDIATNLLDQIYKERLNDVQRELLLAFSVYREPVMLEAAQAIITNVAKGQLPPALKTLRTQHLLEAVGGGRYQLHAIIANYAQSHFNESSETANQEALRVAHARAARHYLEQAAKNCPPHEQRRKISDVHDLIEAVWHLCQAEQWQEAYDVMEREKIYASLRSSGGNAILLELYKLLLPIDKWQPTPLQTARLYNKLSRVYRIIGQMEQAQEYSEQALDICNDTGELEEAGWAVYYLGRTYDDLGSKEKARQCYEQALRILRGLGNRRGEGILLNNLGRIYNELGEKEQAKEYLEQALSICKEVVDQEEENKVLTNLGWVYSDLGQKEQSLKYYEQALAICKEIGDLGGEGWTLNSLGKVYISLGEKERALEFLERALKVRRWIGHRLGESRTLNNLGLVYEMLEQNEQAIRCCEEALSISREIGDHAGEGLIISNLGLIYTTLGRGEQAQEYYEQALAILREVGDRIAESRAFNNLGQVCSMLEQNENALNHYERSLRIRQNVGDRWGEGETLHNIGTLYFRGSYHDAALACLLLAKGIFRELQHPHLIEVQKSIDALHEAVGDEQFATLLARVEPQAQQIVDQALRKAGFTSAN